MLKQDLQLVYTINRRPTELGREVPCRHTTEADYWEHHMKWWQTYKATLPACNEPQPPIPVLVDKGGVVVAMLRPEALDPAHGRGCATVAHQDDGQTVFECGQCCATYRGGAVVLDAAEHVHVEGTDGEVLFRGELADLLASHLAGAFAKKALRA